MKIDLDKLLTVSNFALLKGLSRQHVYRLVENKELTLISIDGVSFVFMDEKAVDFVRKRSK
jgi:translation elongation factor P/translation initiation factor 5A